ncbi:MAG: cysteine peptidase family C39 domain-containing protein [Planctomycetota bacterium]
MLLLRALLGAAVLAGCQSLPSIEELRAELEQDSSRGHLLDTVPFVRQESGGCGQAALASVLAYHGLQRDPSELARDTYLSAASGTLPFDLAYEAQRRGFATREMRGVRLAALLLWLDAGLPVITLRAAGPPLARQHHYDVLVGYDDRDGILVLHDGERPFTMLTYASFLSHWTGWALAVLSEENVSKARLAEQAEQEGELEEARRYYRAHLAGCPADLLAAFNLAGLEEDAEAQPIYEAILKLSPDDGPTLNNLADLLIRTGQDRDRAAGLLAHAIEVDPANADLYRQTLAEAGAGR